MRHTILLTLTLILTLGLVAPAMAERGYRGHQDGNHQGYERRDHGGHGVKRHHRQRHHARRHHGSRHHHARRHHGHSHVIERRVIVREDRHHHSRGVPLVTIDGYPLVTLDGH